MSATVATSHTPGPWQVVHKRAFERPVHIREHFAVRPADGPTLAFLPEGRADIQEANARLIAAAPELLRFVKAFAEEKTETEQHGNWNDRAAMERIILRARALVADVEGGA